MCVRPGSPEVLTGIFHRCTEDFTALTALANRCPAKLRAGRDRSKGTSPSAQYRRWEGRSHLLEKILPSATEELAVRLMAKMCADGQLSKARTSKEC